MKNSLKRKLWESSEVLWTTEEDGWKSLKPEVAIPAGVLLLFLFLLVSGWAG